MERVKIEEQYMNNGTEPTDLALPIAEDNLDDILETTPDVLVDPAVVEPDTVVDDAAVSDQVVEPIDGTTAIDKYTADFKYRADNQDKEIPEYLRAVIKDKATEEQVKSILSKADGVEALSRNREEIRIARDEARADATNWRTSAEDLKKSYLRGDADSFFKMLQVSDEFVMKYAVEKAKSMQDAQYRQQLEQQTAAKRQAWAQEDKTKEYGSRVQELEVKDLQNQFNYEMMKPEVSQFQQAYDKMVGKNGAFIEECKNRGELAYHRTSKIASAGEVIQGIMSSYKGIGSVQSQSAPTAPQAAVKHGITKLTKTPTIPTVGGTQSTPVSEGFTSMEELRAYKNKLRSGAAR